MTREQLSLSVTDTKYKIIQSEQLYKKPLSCSNLAIFSSSRSLGSSSRLRAQNRSPDARVSLC